MAAPAPVVQLRPPLPQPSACASPVAAPAPAPAHQRPLQPCCSTYASGRTGTGQTATAHNAAKTWKGRAGLGFRMGDQDMGGYLGAYAKTFQPKGQTSRAAWEKSAASIVGRAKINVGISDLSVKIDGDKAQARFRQQYSSGSLNVSSRKTLDMVNQGGRWAIVRESTGG